MGNGNSNRQLMAIGLILGCMAGIPHESYADTPAGTSGTPSGQVYSLGEITVEAKRPDWESKLSPGTVTVIRPADYKGEQKTLPDLLKEVPGVHVREVNGKGQYTTVTIRGSTAAQVGVFIDGVLSNLGGDSAVDISAIPVKNVERVEVYRGYIPSRFGGTFIGGVINVVTKRPTRANVSAEVGSSSFGGRSGSVEVTAPLRSGSLLVGLNYDSSDGDFPYKNYAASRDIPETQQNVASGELSVNNLQTSIANFNTDNIESLAGGTDPLIQLTKEQQEYYTGNTDAWLEFVRDGGLSSAIESNSLSRAESYASSGISKFYGTIEEMGLDKSYIQAGAQAGVNANNWMTAAAEDWKSNEFTDFFTSAVKQEIIEKYAQDTAASSVATWTAEADPDKSSSLKNEESKLTAAQKALEQEKKQLKAMEDNRRHRQYNDYKNTSGIVKWQNDNWTIKGSWSRIDRHLPDSLWGDSFIDAPTNAYVDVGDIYYAESRHQILDNKELLIQNRHQNGRLEWGWMLDGLHQTKSYNTEHKLDWPDNFRWQNVPLREWSKYSSNKYNGQIDGSYKLSDRQMLDFQTNYSRERLKVNGSLMDKVLGDTVIGNLLGQMRNKYDQNIFNMQVQDTITLDKRASWFLTPSLRYNQSIITGYSDGDRFSVNQDSKFHWIHPKDSQKDAKGTWQLALKKIVNDNLTFRMTGGTYFRLLNMYEIAGDGAGILPATTDGKGSVFPQPEYGKQFDLSALWNGHLFHASNSTTLTYFWRNSDRMLQLFRAGLDYWSYFNDNRGKVHGIELQSNFKWEKFSLNTDLTYTNSHMQQKNSTVGYGYTDIWPTYQPEWESNIRFTWMPNKHISVFDEIHYTGLYYTYYGKSTEGEEASKLMGRPVPALTVMNIGVKWKPSGRWQYTLGCNDVFNKGPQLKIWSSSYGYPAGYINPDYPIQGRTYYGTIRYTF